MASEIVFLLGKDKEASSMEVFILPEWMEHRVSFGRLRKD